MSKIKSCSQNLIFLGKKYSGRFSDFWHRKLNFGDLQDTASLITKVFCGIFLGGENLHLVGCEPMYSKGEVTLKLASSSIVLVGSC